RLGCSRPRLFAPSRHASSRLLRRPAHAGQPQPLRLGVEQRGVQRARAAPALLERQPGAVEAGGAGPPPRPGPGPGPPPPPRPHRPPAPAAPPRAPLLAAPERRRPAGHCRRAAPPRPSQPRLQIQYRRPGRLWGGPDTVTPAPAPRLPFLVWKTREARSPAAV